nr:MAG TPA: hypothetical protein [Caudoviricetes sp.]
MLRVINVPFHLAKKRFNLLFITRFFKTNMLIY